MALSEGFEKIAAAVKPKKKTTVEVDLKADQDEFKRQPLSGPDTRGSDIGPYYTLGVI